MIDFKRILGVRPTESDHSDPSLTVNLRQLTEMRRYVPYLKSARFRLTSEQNGNVRSSFKGRGMEFEEIRTYAYGDDVRGIDWRVTARKNQPYTKLYAEEKDREVWVWTDLSAQMRFGTKHELKSVTASKTTALIGWLCLSAKDRFGLAVFDGQKTHIFRPERTRERLLFALKNLETISLQTLMQTEDAQDFSESLKSFQAYLKHRSVLFLVGCFQKQHEEAQRLLKTLAQRHEMYLINIGDSLEFQAPPQGVYPVEFQNRKGILVSRGKNFEHLYENYFETQRRAVRDFCDHFKIGYHEIRSDLPIHRQLKF